jgi:hypothetical protein
MILFTNPFGFALDLQTCRACQEAHQDYDL